MLVDEIDVLQAKAIEQGVRGLQLSGAGPLYDFLIKFERAKFPDELNVDGLYKNLHLVRPIVREFVDFIGAKN